MFTNETLTKYVNNAKNALKKAMENPEEIKLHISTGNKKLKALNVSILPVLTCPNCTECKKLCYDIKACLQYPNNVLKARAENTALCLTNHEKYFGLLWTEMRKRKANKYLRFHVGGDIPNYRYLCFMVKTAVQFPDWIIWTYTKNYNVVNEYVEKHGNEKKCIPSNFSIMFSEWKNVKMNNPYGFPVFRCVLKGEKENPDNWKCTGNCNLCLKLKHGCVVGESAEVAEH